MAALAHLPVSTHQDAPAPPSLTVEDMRRLNLLRLFGARCRVMGKSDLFRACVMLSDDQTTATEGYAEALIRVLPGLIGRRLRLYRPGCSEVSFDETWLMSTLAAARRGDEASLGFLLASRLPQHARRQIGFLLTNLSRTLDNTL